MSRENQRGAMAELLLTMSPFFSVFPALLLLLGAISDGAKSWCLGEGSGAEALLESGQKWCLLVMGAEALGLVLILAVSILSARALWRRRATGVWMNLLKMAVLPLLVVGLFGGLMLRDDVLPLYRDARADLKQIAAGTLEEREVWFLPGSVETHLPGGFDVEKNLLRCQVCTAEGERLTVYLPLGFHPEAEYQVSQDAAWNVENVPQYRIGFTSGIGLVAEGPVPVS